MRNRSINQWLRDNVRIVRMPIILSLLAFSPFGIVQGQNTQPVPEQSGLQQVGATQTNHPAQTSQTQTNQSQGRRGRNGPNLGAPTLGLDQGYIELATPDFKLKLVKASQTLAALQPKDADGFDFTPADQLESRAADRFYHLGDLTLRLRVGYGGTMGALSNIDPDGFAAAAFHSSPALLKWDTYSGDYGPNFFGHAINTATYVINHPEFGWQAFGGNVKVSGNWAKIKPLDSFRQRVYIAPLGLWLTLDAGTFDSVEVSTKTHAVRVGLSAATPDTPQGRLRIEQPAKVAGAGTYHPREKLVNERDGFTIPLKGKMTWVELSEVP